MKAGSVGIVGSVKRATDKHGLGAGGCLGVAGVVTVFVTETV